MPDRDLRYVLYTADDGTQYRTKQDQFVILQQDGALAPITGAVEVVTENNLQEIPRGLRPRGVYVRRAGQRQRFVVCMTSTAPLYTGSVGVINLQQIGVAALSYTRHKTKSQRDYRKAAGIGG